MDTKHPLEVWRGEQKPPMTQASVADAIGLRAPFISLLENGERFASIKTARRLAGLTGLSFEVFLPPAEPAAVTPQVEAAAHG